MNAILDPGQSAVTLLRVVVVGVDHHEIDGRGGEQIAGKIEYFVQGNGDDHQLLAANRVFDGAAARAGFGRQLRRGGRSARIGYSDLMSGSPEQAGNRAADVASADIPTFMSIPFDKSSDGELRPEP